MSLLPNARKLAGGRLARRLFALFVLAALLPVALSDWMSTRAVSDVAEELHQRSHERSTRMVSRAVLDRLITAHDLLLTMPASEGLPESAPGLGTVFSRISQFAADGSTRWTLTTPAAAGQPAARPGPQADLAADGPAAVRLWADPQPSPQPRLLMRAYRNGQLRWQAELAPLHVWGPITVDNPDARWRVRDNSGRTLLSHSPGGTQPESAAGWSTPDTGMPLDKLRVAQAQLPLAGLLGSGQWTFEQKTPREDVRWMGAPLAYWLGGLAALTVLAAALVAHWRIRQLFEPLEALAEGTRRLAAGDSQARVAVTRKDEIGALAGSFNLMAGRIDHQLSALRAMAAIDHDILSGVALERIAEQVVRQLADWLPEADVLLSWCSGDKVLHSCGAAARPEASAAAGAGAAGLLRLSGVRMHQAQRCAFATLDQDSHLPAGVAPRQPWLPLGAADDGSYLSMLPLRAPGRTQALLALRWPRAPDDLQLRPARELRDRLAVALAARAREEELLHRALHDSLTGLANRDGLSRQLQGLLLVPADAAETTTIGVQASAPALALLVVDLDHFKDINDSLGHVAGDQVLRVCAERLLASAPSPAVVARLGGDEFVLLLPGAGAEEALSLGERLLEQLRQPLQVGEHDCVLDASIGIALAPLHGRTPLELLRRADIALYAAKRQGRACQSIFAEAMDQAALQRLQLQGELRRAIEQQEFVLHYQPRVRADNGEVVSVEALVRWQHPQRGLLPPGAFIEQAEAGGLINALGSLVLSAACRQAAAWQQQGLGLHRVSVNVSPQQLQSGQLPEQVRRKLARHGLPASALELEVTESLLVQNGDSARQQLVALREMGVCIALDDFGTGYSSMAMLRQLPIDVMKIDRAFVSDLDSDDSALAIARAIVSLASTLGLRVVAEGVETEGQAVQLRRLGCQELQGYLFARPMPAAALQAHVLAAQSRSGSPTALSALAALGAD
jgi:diguanylate cyclase (GGDEF)-like protein